MNDASPMRGGPGGEGESLAIAVCTLNRGERITATLRAIDAQANASGRLRRCVVVDNASTDATAEVVRRFIGGGTRVAFELVSAPARGKSNAIAAFLAATDEPLVATIDDDVVVGPDWAQRMLKVFDERPRAGIVTSRVMVRFAVEGTAAELVRPFFGGQDYGAESGLMEGERLAIGAATAKRRRALAESGWPGSARLDCVRGGAEGKGELRSGQDFDLCARVRNAGWEVWYEAGAVVEHHIAAERCTLEYAERLSRSCGVSQAEIMYLANREPGVAWARERLARALRRERLTRRWQWRPARRRLDLAFHSGRREGWEELVARLTAEEGGTKDVAGATLVKGPGARV